MQNAVTLRRVVSFEPEAEQVWKGRHMVLMFRSENVGMDIAAHNVRSLFVQCSNRIQYMRLIHVFTTCSCRQRSSTSDWNVGYINTISS